MYMLTTELRIAYRSKNLSRSATICWPMAILHHHYCANVFDIGLKGLLISYHLFVLHENKKSLRSYQIFIPHTHINTY